MPTSSCNGLFRFVPVSAAAAAGLTSSFWRVSLLLYSNDAFNRLSAGSNLLDYHSEVIFSIFDHSPLEGFYPSNPSVARAAAPRARTRDQQGTNINYLICHLGDLSLGNYTDMPGLHHIVTPPGKQSP